MALIDVNRLKERLVKALTPWFLGREQDALIEAMKTAGEETLLAVDVDTAALQAQLTNLYSNAGADAIGTASGNSVEEELALKIPLTQKGASNGVATLGADGLLTTAQIPDITITDTFAVGSQAAMLALTAQKGDVAIRTDQNKTYILAADPATTLINWKEILTPTAAVTSVFGRVGVVTAQSGDYTVGQVTGAAPLANPTFTGTVSGATGSFSGAFSASSFTSTGSTFIGGSNVVLATAAAAGGVFLRPNAVGSTTGELVVTTSGVTWNTNTMWHSGNFAPATKANLAAPTFTGMVTFTNGDATLTHFNWNGTSVNYIRGNTELSSKASVGGAIGVGAGEQLKVYGGITSSGASSAFIPRDRSTNREWTLYATADIFRIFNGSTDVATVDVNGNLRVNALRAGAWPSSPQYMGIFHTDMTSLEYMIMSGGASDNNTYISTLTTGTGNVVIRPNGNVATFATAFSNTGILTETSYIRRNAAGGGTNTLPRIFVQSGDPGTAAGENDLWFW